MIFGALSRYYDLLYRDKDYAGEAAYVLALLRAHGASPESILELGVGTGNHAFLMADDGLSVTGIDQSKDMIAAAEQRRQTQPESTRQRLNFRQADMRTVRLGQEFDAVLSLFHVVSYQVENSDLELSLRTAFEHLRPGGLFVFDFWHGPAVLTELPSVRVRRLQDELTSIVRISEPELLSAKNAVVVNYELFITERQSGNTEVVRESHRMRYLFQPELDSLLSRCGFVGPNHTSEFHYEEWMNGKPVELNSFGVVCVARRPETA